MNDYFFFQVANWVPLKPKERVYIVEAGTPNASLLDVKVLTAVGSSQVRILFQPDTSVAKTFQFKMLRFMDSSERQPNQYDLISPQSPFAYEPSLTFDWAVDNLSPNIVSIYPTLADSSVSLVPT